MCGKRQKQLVITRPYHPKSDHSHVLRRRIADESDPLYGSVGKLRNNDAMSDVEIGNLLHDLTDVLSDERGRIIGRAMSNADRPGDAFDILLGRYSA